jgi:hypothetical protein
MEKSFRFPGSQKQVKDTVAPLLKTHLLTLTGKTIIFSAIIEELKSRFKGNKSFAVAYVYCKYNNY